MRSEFRKYYDGLNKKEKEKCVCVLIKNIFGDSKWFNGLTDEEKKLHMPMLAIMALKIYY